MQEVVRCINSKEYQELQSLNKESERRKNEVCHVGATFTSFWSLMRRDGVNLLLLSFHRWSIAAPTFFLCLPRFLTTQIPPKLLAYGPVCLQVTVVTV